MRRHLTCNRYGEHLVTSLTNHLVIHAFVWKDTSKSFVWVWCIWTLEFMHERAGLRTQELVTKNKKENGCMCNRLILHRGRSGIYLSQQREPSEGWCLEPLCLSGAQSRAGTPKMDERGAKREKVDQRVGENRSGGEDSWEDAEEEKVSDGWMVFLLIPHWVMLHSVCWLRPPGGLRGRLCVCLLALGGRGITSL